MVRVVFALILATIPESSLASTMYSQTNLVSDLPGLGQFTDPNLQNPWGMSFSATGPFWISNEVSGNSTIYNGSGVPQALVVTTPPASPTGQAFAGGAGFIEPGTGQPATFIFATESGSIDAWNPGNGTIAQIVATTPGAVYTGLTIANNGSGNFLYAANFAAGTIDVFNTNFSATALGGSFTDPTLPSGYSPFNISNVNGTLYVMYAKEDSGEEEVGAGFGFVDKFDANGNFLGRAVSQGLLNAPWGITLAPPDFGEFSNALLIGNFGDGKINVFDPVTYSFLGTISDENGNPIVNSGLWEIRVRTGGTGVDTSAIYFTAGINDEENGLFGRIQVVPEPGTMLLCAVGLMAVRLSASRRKRCS